MNVNGDWLRKEIVTISQDEGVDKVGFTTRERLEDAPPSGHLDWVLPGARSAISLCSALDRDAIRSWLKKQDFWPLSDSRHLSYNRLFDAAKRIESLLADRGHDVVVPFLNGQWRKGNSYEEMIAPLSHRYVAIASGIGWLGWSGNLLTAEFGAATNLLTVVTSADLEPSPLAEAAEGFCQDCHLCVAVCPAGFMSLNEKDTIAISGRTHTHNKKNPNFRCMVVCNGLSGVRDPDAEWSTWSYSVLDFSGCDDNEAFKERLLEYASDPRYPGVQRTIDSYARGGFTDWEQHRQFWTQVVNEPCGNCQLICWPGLEDRRENHRLLTTSGRMTRESFRAVYGKRKKVITGNSSTA